MKTLFSTCLFTLLALLPTLVNAQMADREIQPRAYFYANYGSTCSGANDEAGSAEFTAQLSLHSSYADPWQGAATGGDFDLGSTGSNTGDIFTVDWLNYVGVDDFLNAFVTGDHMAKGRIGYFSFAKQLGSGSAFNLYMRGWEDDRGSRYSYDCCGTFTNDDDCLTTYQQLNIDAHSQESLYFRDIGHYDFDVHVVTRYSSTQSGVALQPNCADQSASYSAGDIRSWPVYLQSGVRYYFSSCGGANEHTELAIYEGGKTTALSVSANGCSNGSNLYYTAPETGTYILEVSGSNQTNTSLNGAVTYKVIPASHSVVASKVDVCIGDQVNLTSSNPGQFVSFEYQWDRTSGGWQTLSSNHPYNWSASAVSGPERRIYVRAKLYNGFCHTYSSTRGIDVFNPDHPDFIRMTTTDASLTGSEGTVRARGRGAFPLSYSWSNSSTGSMLDSVPAGLYCVTVTDDNGCTSSNCATVDADPCFYTMQFDFDNTQLSSSSAVDGAIDLTVSYGNLPLTFAWSTGATTEDLTALPAGRYGLTVTDDYGCQNSGSTYVVPPHINDGPINLRVRAVQYFARDRSQAEFGLQELTWLISARDNADEDGIDWLPAACVTFGADSASMEPNGYTSPYEANLVMNNNYGVDIPQYIQLKIDAYEDDCQEANRCEFNSSCYSGLNQDDLRCLQEDFAGDIPYKLFPAEQWTDHGWFYACNNAYGVRIETYWEYSGIPANSTADGPIRLEVRADELYASEYRETFAGTAENTWILAINDLANLDGPANSPDVCFTSNTLNTAYPHTYVPSNKIVSDHTYTSLVPNQYRMRMQAWEDDRGDRCEFDTDNNIFNDDDDGYCIANSSYVSYRNNPPGQWNSDGPLSACANEYRVSFSSRWSYTNGDLISQPIALGTFNCDTQTINHYNNSSIYSNASGSPEASQEVYYSFSLSQNSAVEIHTCDANTLFNTYLYLLDNSGEVVDSNDNWAGCTESSLYSRISISDLAAGSWYIVVEAGSAGANGLFDLELMVTPKPTIDFSGLPDEVCVNGDSISLTGIPSGGTFSGAGLISGDTLVPENAGVGTHEITYSGLNEFGCQTSISKNITILALPLPSFSGLPDSICHDGDTVFLNPGQPGGTFGGLGVNAQLNAFIVSNAAPGLQQVYYEITDTNGCNNADTSNTLVLQSVPSFTLPIAFCAEPEDAIVLVPDVLGGTFSGDGISNDTFDATGLNAGQYTVTYSGTDNNGCSYLSARTATVRSAPDASFSGLPETICANAGPVELIPLNEGGSFTGDGVSDSLFYPAQASSSPIEIAYSYTDPYGCSASSVDSVGLLSSSAVVFESFCAGDTVQIGDSIFTEAGLHTARLTSSVGCDSLVAFNLVLVEDSSLCDNPCATEPNAACYASITMYIDPNGYAEVSLSQIDSASSAECGIFSLTVENASLACNRTNQTFVNLLLVDSAGQNASCQTAVTMIDTVPPTISCVDTSFNITEGECHAYVDYVLPVAVDNCGSTILSLSSGLGSGDTFAVGTHLEQYVATDDAGYTIGCTMTVTVVDNQPPIAVCSSITTQIQADKTATPDVSLVGALSEDNCGVVSYALTPPTFACSDTGSNVVTLVVADAAGGTSSCTATIVVANDSFPCLTPCDTLPQAICINVTAALEDTSVDVPASLVNHSSHIPCGLTSMTLTPSTFDCDDLGANTVTLEVVDVNENASSCTATVTVNDQINPTASCTDLTIVLDSAGLATQYATVLGQSSTDNCGGIASFSSSPDTLNCSDLGTNTVTLTIRDSSNNSATCTANVTVVDSQAVALSCPPDTNLNCAFSVTFNVLVIDNCPGAVLTQTAGLPNGADYPSGLTTNSYSVTDMAGNTDDCTFNVTVIAGTIPDTLTPKIQRAPDDTVPLPLIKKHSFGSSVNGIGDIDKDGNQDLAVGASSSPLNPTQPFKSKDAGEVFILLQQDTLGTIKSVSHIGANRSGAFQVPRDSMLKKTGFGSSLVGIGDMDGDGTEDIAIGQPGYSTVTATGSKEKSTGAVNIFFLNSDASVKNWHRIAVRRKGLGDILEDKFEFGGALANIGDLDQDGIIDLAVGATGDNAGNKKLKQSGGVYILFMQSGGTVKSSQRIADGIGGVPANSLQKKEFFGSDIANLGDIDGDGVTDLAVGSLGYSPINNAGKKLTFAGAMRVLFMNTDGTVKSLGMPITHDALPGFNLNPKDAFGLSLSRVLDQDNDGINDVAVGAPGSDPIDPVKGKPIKDAGKVYLVRLQSDGSMKSFVELNPDTSVIQQFNKKDQYGSSVGALNDICFTILAVGASGDNNPIIVNGRNKLLANAGAVYLSIPKNLAVASKRNAILTSGLAMPNSEDEAELSLQNLVDNEQLLLYPNPTNGMINLVVPQTETSFAEVKIYNTLGQRVYSIRHEIGEDRLIQIDLGDRKPGQYIINTVTDTATYSGSFVFSQ